MNDSHTPEIAALVGRLLDRYVQARDVTGRLRQLVERDDVEAAGKLDALVTEREALVAEAERLLAAILQRRDELRTGMAAELEQALSNLLEEDARLRTALSASAQEVPRQLARLHSGRIGLRGYQATMMGQSDLIDRSG